MLETVQETGQYLAEMREEEALVHARASGKRQAQWSTAAMAGDGLTFGRLDGRSHNEH